MDLTNPTIMPSIIHFLPPRRLPDWTLKKTGTGTHAPTRKTPSRNGTAPGAAGQNQSETTPASDNDNNTLQKGT
jgi:hypothetical protein